MRANHHGGQSPRRWPGIDVLARAQAVDNTVKEVNDELTLQAITA